MNDMVQLHFKGGLSTYFNHFRENIVESEKIKTDISAFIQQNFLFSISEATVKADDSFIEKGILDSTGVLELVSFIEEKFGFRCADHELTPQNFDSVNAVAQFVFKKTS